MISSVGARETRNTILDDPKAAFGLTDERFEAVHLGRVRSTPGAGVAVDIRNHERFRRLAVRERHWSVRTRIPFPNSKGVPAKSAGRARRDEPVGILPGRDPASGWTGAKIAVQTALTSPPAPPSKPAAGESPSRSSTPMSGSPPSGTASTVRLRGLPTRDDALRCTMNPDRPAVETVLESGFVPPSSTATPFRGHRRRLEGGTRC